MIKSQAWKNSLKTDEMSTSLESTDFYASTSDKEFMEVTQGVMLVTDAAFIEKYNSLVARAYFKLIIEAEEADDRLTEEYNRLNAIKQHGPKEKETLKNNPILVNKRYQAHKELLEGLKSWNIFSEYRTGDLEYFKKEHINDTHKMFQNGADEDNIISFLVYKLADLYHSED